MASNSPYVDGGAILGAAQYLATAPTNLATDGYRNLQCDSAGNLKCNVVSGGGGGSVGAVQVTDPTTSTNQAAVQAPGVTGAFGLGVQGLGPTATPLPVSGSLSITTVSGTANVAVSSLPALPSGSNVIGQVGISGTANVNVAAALPSGGNVIGQVGISGTANVAVTTVSGTANVNVATALPTGGNVIGQVGISGTPNVAVTTVSGTANVNVATALPTGGNVIGQVGISGTPNVAVTTVSGTVNTAPQVAGSAVSATNPLPTTAAQLARTDKSGTITSGGTAQDVFAAAAAVHGFYLQNLSTVSMYIRDDGTAASAASGSILVPANGGYYESPPLSTPTSKLSVFCATTSSAFTCKVW